MRTIAIIGGGITGTSTAYYLKKLLGRGVQIDLYEPGELGGRLATARVDGKDYEIGASIMHSRNRYTTLLMDKLGLTRHRNVGGDKFAGFINENGFVLVFSKYNFITKLKLFLRYGWDVVSLPKKINSMLDSFDRIYTLQMNNQSFNTVNGLLRAADPDFVKFTQISTHEGFLADGFSERTIEELIHSTLQCNYGQSTCVPKLVGSVSLAPAFGGYNFSIVGGNKQLPERLLKFSEANLIKEIVRQITRDNNSKIIVSTGEKERIYDDVVICTPITQDEKRLHKITFNNFKKKIQVSGRYHTTVCTLVRGVINNTFFGFKTPDDVPNPIYSVSNSLFYSSISKIFPVGEPKCSTELIWKVFSHDILTKDQLNNLFKDFTVESVTEWLAYPSYLCEKRSDSFVLDENLYYTNAMEWSASAVETCLIGAQNVALLIHKSLKQREKNCPTDNNNNLEGDK